MGTAAKRLDDIDVVAMSHGNHLTWEERAYLIALVTDQEIKKSLKGISDLKAPSIDGYGSNFFKATWEITQRDMIRAVGDFFIRVRCIGLLTTLWRP